MKSKKEIPAIVSYINLGGIGFTTDSETTLEKRKVYTLKLKAVSESRNVEFDVKIMIIKIGDNGDRSCSAVYRKLIDSQIAGLKEISENFAEEFVWSDKLEAIIMK